MPRVVRMRTGITPSAAPLHAAQQGLGELMPVRVRTRPLLPRQVRSRCRTSSGTPVSHVTCRMTQGSPTTPEKFPYWLKAASGCAALRAAGPRAPGMRAGARTLRAPRKTPHNLRAAPKPHRPAVPQPSPTLVGRVFRKTRQTDRPGDRIYPAPQVTRDACGAPYVHGAGTASHTAPEPRSPPTMRGSPCGPPLGGPDAGRGAGRHAHG